MYTQTSNRQLAEGGKSVVLIPLIRAAATIGFAIAPCSLGFVIIAVSEHLIRSIMVGDDPEMLMSDLQNQFPNDAFEIIENDDAELVAKVVDLIERPEQAFELPADIRGTGIQTPVWDPLQTAHAGSTMNYTFLAEQIGGPVASAAAQADASPVRRTGETASFTRAAIEVILRNIYGARGFGGRHAPK